MAAYLASLAASYDKFVNFSPNFCLNYSKTF